ncbi:sigma 54-interacting transcriptional regulator [Sporosarcina sp. FA9]|uniref:sigma 54-interacting transcriptional regulator n=1 Tax=Sporosarcina sp. FA9 TaxID=3413030 RepID=UPI003F656363
MKHSVLKVNLEDIVSNSFEGVIITDHEGKILLVNKVSLRFFPMLTFRDLMGRSVREFLFSKELNQFFTNKQEMRNIPLTIGMNQLLADFRFIDSKHSYIALKNVTHLKQLENELSEVNEKLRLFDKILDNVSDGVCLIDNEKNVVFYNQKMGELDSEEPNNIRGGKYTLFSRDCDSRPDTLLNSLKTEKEIIQNEAFIANSGKKYNVVRYCKPLFLGNKKIGALSIVKDYSNTKSTLDNILNQYNPPGDSSTPLLQKEKQLNEIIFSTNSMRKIVDEAHKIAKTFTNVLVYGESGVGKNLLVETILTNSGPYNSPFYSLNCGAIPDHLLEEALFGSVDSTKNAGFLELANGGTIYLDEINSIGIPLQRKIARVIKNMKLVRAGTVSEIPLKIRFLASMNVTPVVAFEEGTVDEDLLYSIGAVCLRMPALRERKEDIPALANYLLDKNHLFSMQGPEFIGEDAMDILQSYNFPGNIRQLAHIIEGTLSLTDGEKVVLPEHLPGYIQNVHNIQTGSPNEFSDSFQTNVSSYSLTDQVEAFEKGIISRELKNTNYHITNAAKNLGLSRQSLNYKIKKYELSIERGGDED